MNRKNFFNFILLIVFLFSLTGIPQQNAGAIIVQPTLCPDGSIVFGTTQCPSELSYNGVLYASPNGSNSQCWHANSPCSLQQAIAQGVVGLQSYGDRNSDYTIRVEEGTYYPTSSTDPSISFQLGAFTSGHGLKLYGGWNSGFSKRDPSAYPTILSGDIGVQGDNSDNSYHVVKIVDADATTLLNGFTIINGNANVLPETNGGGIYLSNSKPQLVNLFIHDNRATNGGGGIYNSANSNPYIEGLTLSNNYAGEGGGGMYNHFSAPTLVNVTFSGNTTDNWGGGMTNYQSNAKLMNVTFSGNTTAQPSGYAGGMFNVGEVPTPVYPIMVNSIIANSTGGDCLGQFQAAYNNLIETAYAADPNNTTCELVDGVQGNIVGMDPELGTLADNGGISETHALLTGSLAIDGGTNAYSSGGFTIQCPTYDERGQKRAATLTDYCDMGAFEYSLSATPASVQANRYAAPGGLSTGTCTSWALACDLEHALVMARSGDQLWVKAGTYKPSGTDRTSSFTLKRGVEVYGGFAGAETQLSQRNPALNKSILSGDIGTLSDSSDNVYHVVDATGVDSSTILDGFTITGGNANGAAWPDFNGGGILNYQGNPTLANLVITGNNASNGGGGMINDTAGVVDMVDVTFSNNTAGSAGGGGLLNWLAENVTLTRTTFSGNSTTGDGGGVESLTSSIAIRESTFSDNSASGTNGGGALYNPAGSTLTLRSTILANSTAGGDCVGIVDTANNNLIEDASNACGLSSPDANGNLLGVDPMLGSLADNGGTTPTRALLVGSPALDGGSTTFCPSPDQRGMPRPDDGNNDGTWACDIGAYEYTIAPTVSSITRVDTDPTSKNSVSFTVTFSEYVTGVDAADFTLTQTGSLSGSSITSVSGSTGTTFTVTVNTGSGNGTLRLDALNDGTVKDFIGNVLAAGFTTGQVYTVQKVLTLLSRKTQDGWVLESGETTNKGGSMNSTDTTFRLGDNATKSQYRGILSFTTSALPDDAEITSVTLKIKRQSVTGKATPAMFKGFVFDIRNGYFKTTSSLQTTDFQTAASTPSAGIASAPSVASGLYTFNLTTAAKNYINKTTTNSGLTQIRLRFKLDDNNNTAANFISFYSGNSAANSPTLIIQYYVP